MSARILLLGMLAFSFVTSAVFANDEMAALREQVRQLRESMQQMQQKVEEQQQIIDKLQVGKEPGGIEQELQQIQQRQAHYDQVIQEMHELYGLNKTEDLLDTDPEEGFLRGNAFYIRLGLTREPFENDEGYLAGGAIDLKMMDSEYGSLLGMIGLNFIQSQETINEVTSAVLGAQQNQELTLNSLTADLNFKFRFDRLGEPGSFTRRFQPYFRAGMSLQVFISNSDGLIAGQVPQAEELEDRNIPVGQGNLYFGLNVGTGFEFMITRMFFIGFDYSHYELFTENGSSDSFAMTTGLRF